MNKTIILEGSHPYWDEIIDSLESSGIECFVDERQKTVEIDATQVVHANSVLVEIMQLLEEEGF